MSKIGATVGDPSKKDVSYIKNIIVYCFQPIKMLIH